MRLSMCEKQKSMLPCQTQFHASTPILFRSIFLTASTYNSFPSFLILSTEHRICVRIQSIFQYQSTYYYIFCTDFVGHFFFSSSNRGLQSQSHRMRMCINILSIVYVIRANLYRYAAERFFRNSNMMSATLF